jgi:transposase
MHRTIPGIGKKSAIYLLTFFKTYPNANRQQITALAGLDVIERSSGTSVSGRKKISKSGNKRIRTILYFPTMNAIRYNELLKKQYERLLSNNKKKKVAIIACMRKLILVSYAMFKNKTEFSLDFNHSI